MLKFIWSFLLILSLVGCSSRTNEKDRTPPPPFSDAVLIDFKPIFKTHIPLVQYLRHDAQRRIKVVYVTQEWVNTSSWISFKNSTLGKNLIGAMFKNYDPNNDLCLWFKLQLTPVETIEYNLELTQRGLYYLGYESITRIEKDIVDITRISVTFQKHQLGDI